MISAVAPGAEPLSADTGGALSEVEIAAAAATAAATDSRAEEMGSRADARSFKGDLTGDETSAGTGSALRFEGVP